MPPLNETGFQEAEVLGAKISPKIWMGGFELKHKTGAVTAHGANCLLYLRCRRQGRDGRPKDERGWGCSFGDRQPPIGGSLLLLELFLFP